MALSFLVPAQSDSIYTSALGTFVNQASAVSNSGQEAAHSWLPSEQGDSGEPRGLSMGTLQ